MGGAISVRCRHDLVIVGAGGFARETARRPALSGDGRTQR
jgi:hypothetical protein